MSTPAPSPRLMLFIMIFASGFSLPLTITIASPFSRKSQIRYPLQNFPIRFHRVSQLVQVGREYRIRPHAVLARGTEGDPKRKFANFSLGGAENRSGAPGVHVSAICPLSAINSYRTKQISIVSTTCAAALKQSQTSDSRRVNLLRRQGRVYLLRR